MLLDWSMQDPCVSEAQSGHHCQDDC